MPLQQRHYQGEMSLFQRMLLLLLLLLRRLSRVRLCATPWTAAYLAPLSMGFSRLSSGLPLPSQISEDAWCSC